MSSPRASGILGPWDRTEVQTQDDLAAHRADEFLAMAMLDHELRKRGGQAIQRGMCASCGQVCAPAAVYCDADCREDHELQLAAQARAGRAA